METQFNDGEVDPNREYYCSDITRSTGFNSIMKYTLLGQHNLLEQCLTTDNVNHTNTKGWSSLMLACRNSNATSNIETVKLLLKYKADVNLGNCDEQTPLMASCQYFNTQNSIDIVKLLLDHKANVNHMARTGWTVLMASFRYSTENDIIKLLLDYKANVNIRV